MNLTFSFTPQTVGSTNADITLHSEHPLNEVCGSLNMHMHDTYGHPCMCGSRCRGMLEDERVLTECQDQGDEGRTLEQLLLEVFLPRESFRDFVGEGPWASLSTVAPSGT